MFRAYYGPVAQGVCSIDADGQKALEADLLTLLRKSDTGGTGGLVVPAEYLETVITR